MKRVYLFMVVMFVCAMQMFAQLPYAADVDDKVAANKVFTAQFTVSLNNAGVYVLRVNPIERCFIGGTVTTTNVNSYCDITLATSIYANNASTNTNIAIYNVTNDYWRMTNGIYTPSVIYPVYNANNSLAANEQINLSVLTNTIVLSATNQTYYPNRVSLVGDLFLVAPRLLNTRTYLLYISNSTASTNIYKFNLVFWKQ